MGYDYELIPDSSARKKKRNNLKEEDRRWSVDKKLASRYYCRIRSCEDCCNAIGFKCFLSTSIFIIFIILVVSSIHTYMSELGLISIDEHNFDFIVVGAGPAGCVLARKLIDAGNSVLLLEAGGPTQYDLGGTDFLGPPLTQFDIPLFWTSISQYPEYHWGGFEMSNILLGKGLGGSGVHNAMIYIRCTPSDIVNWKMYGEGGWTWDNVLKTYISLENYIPDGRKSPFASSQDGDIPQYHGNGTGKYSVSSTRSTFLDPVAKLFLSSTTALNISKADDFNDPKTRVGAGLFHFNIKNGLRQSAASTFLGPLLNKKRTSLNISLYSEVQKIIFSKDPEIRLGGMKRDKHPLPKAVGVEFIQNGITHHAYLNRHYFEVDENKLDAYGVILTAGAINTPKILLNSGIGPASDIKKLVHDSVNVGKNLQDHPTVNVKYEVNSFGTTAMPSAYDIIKNWRQYHIATQDGRNGKDVPFSAYGVLGTPGFSSGAFLKSPYCKSSDPDIQLTFFPSSSEPYLEKARKESYSRQYPEILIEVTLMNPDARYEVVLNKDSPFKAPKIQLPEGKSEYLSHRDAKVLAWGVAQVRSIVSHPPLSACIVTEVAPGPQLESEKNLIRWVLDNALPNSHWVGTAKMGPQNDSTAVLDANLRVRGVRNLRVADASVFPRIPNGNVHSSVVMVASRAADLILQQLYQNQDA